MAAGSTDALRRSNSAMTCAARSSARTSESPPPMLPMAVRMPSTMNASRIVVILRFVDRAAEQRDDVVLLIANGHAVIAQPVGFGFALRNGGQHITDVYGRRIRDGVLDAHGDFAMRVRRKRERTVGNGIDDAAVRYTKPVHHLGTNR